MPAKKTRPLAPGRCFGSAQRWNRTATVSKPWRGLEKVRGGRANPKRLTGQGTPTSRGKLNGNCGDGPDYVDSQTVDDSRLQESLVKVGITLLLLHRFEDALWSFREALAVRKHSMGTLHPSTARIYNNIGCVHVELNEFREARRAFEAALDIQRNSLSADPESGPLMFATATTLCNLGYLYRYRDMHAKASMVLKEALELQETVLGRSHATVLSTLDNLADACSSSGQATEALRYYNMVLERFRAGGKPSSQKVLRAEAVLLYKMSRVHRQRNDREAQLDMLKLALRSVRAYSNLSSQKDTLERRIQYDIRACREQLEKEDLKWI